ncbi:MAG: c-type cytochrome [Planctomycetota bacterium]
MQKNLFRAVALALLVLPTLSASIAPSSSGRLIAQESPFQPGDHVVYIGNTLADRMQHHGWLETYIHSMHKRHNLTFRNLGFSGDEVKLRQRANNFGDADQWLTKCKADVIACFFGYNEALKGESNLDKFAKDLTETLSHMKTQKYNGVSAPRIIVFSPIAHEDLKSPHLPDGSENNKNLELYTGAMQKVCEALELPFFNLFAVSKKMYAESEEPLTMNGIHLLDSGNRALALAILDMAAPGEPIPSDDEIAELREAVLDKNYHWFSRYRVVDEYNVFGGRSKLAWFGQSNADVMMREMEIFDVMTENRDKAIWAVAKGDYYEIKDGNLPAELSVRPNREGPLEGGAFPYLGGEEAMEKMTVADDLEVNLFASEEQFPRLINPVQMAVDSDSRLWASVWPSYPHWNPTEPRKDALIILPDENQAGKADELIVFADELNSITGFEFWGGGVLVAAPPEIWFLKDTDGDDKADFKLRVLQGVSSADTHHSANAMVIGPDGWLYWSRGVFNVAAFETPTQTYRSGQTGVHRFNPRTFEMEFHYPIGPNPHGDVFDRWGFQFANDGTSGTGGYVSIGKGQRPGGRQWFKKEWRPVAATGILSSSHFPEKYQNNFLICNTIGFLGVLNYQVQYDGAAISAERTNDVIQSTDPNFRPTDIEVGGDGALYIADWQNTLIGHMQHNMRDPNRDHTHGRIYRVSAKGRPKLTPAKMKDKPIAQVLNHLFSKENNVRYRVRLELSGRESAEVLEAVSSFTSQLNPANSNPDHDEAQALLECLWIHEEHRVPNVDLVSKVYQSAEPRVRAASIRSLGHWAKMIAVDNTQAANDTRATKDNTRANELLSLAARDESALVRAEAAKAATEFEGLGAAEVIFEVANRELDPELNDVLNYARGQIQVDKMISDAIAKKLPLSAAAKTYALQNANAKLLMQMEKSPEVYAAILNREGIDAGSRWEAIEALAANSGRTNFAQLLTSIEQAEESGAPSLIDLADLLERISDDDLRSNAASLKTLCETTKSIEVRQAAFAGWFRSGDVGAAWNQAQTSRLMLGDALAGITMIPDRRDMDRLYASVQPLIFELPEALRSDEDNQPAIAGPAVAYEYYSPNPSNVAMETLDRLKPSLTGSLEDFSVFVPGGKKDGFATRQTAGIVIPQNGQYSFYTSSDDGSRLYIDDQLVVSNDGNHGMVEKSGSIRLTAGLHKIVVTYYDNGGGDGLRVSWKGPGTGKQKIPASNLRPAGGTNLRSRALSLIVSWPGHDEVKVMEIAKLMGDETLGGQALEGLATLPASFVLSNLPSRQHDSILENLLAFAAEATPVDKQSDAYSQLLDLGDALAVNNKSIERAGRKLKDLRSSIPVKADPRVMELGAEVYKRESHCATCHQPHGQGLPNLYPPLDDSLWATGSEERLVRLVLDGMHGTIEVKGKRYSSPPLPPMTGFRHLLNDQEIAAVLTYVRNSWTNRVKPIATQTVSRIRAVKRDKDAVFWAANDLLKKYPLEDGSQPIEQGPTDGWVPQLVKEWTLRDFPAEKLAEAGRSHADGKLWFKRVGCAQCHKLGDEGGVFGPNLAELDAKKRNSAYILESIMDPNKDVAKEYAIKSFLTYDGNVISGFVVKETDDEIVLKADPLSPDKSMVVLKDDIEAESSNGKSVMPQGMLNWMTEEQVLDLVAYVLAAGDEQHEVYSK